MSAVNRFYSAIPEVGKLRQSDLIGYFAYYLTVEMGEASAAPTSLEECFSACDLPVPGSTSAHLSKNLKGREPKFVKVPGGYRLHRSYRDQLSAQLGELRNNVQTNTTLRKLEDGVRLSSEKEFLSELISCFEAGANRAAIIMCWLLAVDHLQSYVLAKQLAAFNSVLAANTDKRVKVAEVRTRDDFADIPEGKFIEFLRSAGIISNDVRKILDGKLGIRNSCAHPSGISVKPSKAIEFIDDLVENVILKYDV